jgi:hypothetical protein
MEATETAFWNMANFGLVYAQPAMKFVPHMLSMDLHVKTVNILPVAEHARHFVHRMLSLR